MLLEHIVRQVRDRTGLRLKGGILGIQVGLLVTCLVDLVRPRVGFATIALLEQAGCEVQVPMLQTCCGQPAYNSGDLEHARMIARDVISAFEALPYIVVPSGSCAGMLRHHYPRLFQGDPQWLARAQAIAERTYELTSFLCDVVGFTGVQSRLDCVATYHDSCSSLREMAVAEQPRRLLREVDGLSLRELPDRESCCGFGGTFCIKFEEISTHMVDQKVRAIEATGADTLLAGDLGCLLNIAGRLSRKGSDVRAFHVAEVLAGVGDAAAIGQPAGRKPQ